MNTTSDPKSTSSSHSEYRMETFPQPRTIPDGWDMADMLGSSSHGYDANVFKNDSPFTSDASTDDTSCNDR